MNSSDLKSYYSQIISYPITSVAVEFLEINGETADSLHCRCPRHNSISGKSLHISKINNQWFCFGCCVGGNTLHLAEFILTGCVSKGKGVTDTHRIARDYLAEKVGLPPLSSHTHIGEINQTEYNHAQQERVFTILTDVVEYYHQRLLSMPIILEWVQKQWGIGIETIKALKIGYSENYPTDEKNIFDYFSLVYPDEDMALTGAFNVYPDEFGIKLSAFFKERIIFPYWKNGLVCFAIGRKTPWTPQRTSENGKYKKLPCHNEHLNKHVSPCIDNSYLYNEDCLSSSLDYVVLTEGITDAIALQMSGIPVISPVTVTIREKDWDRILYKLKKANIKTLYICNDNEVSQVGWKASLKTSSRIEKEGITTKIITLPLTSEQEEARRQIAKLQEEPPADLKEKAKMDVAKYFQTGGTADSFKVLISFAKTPLEIACEQVSTQNLSADSPELLEILESIARLPALKQDFYFDKLKDIKDENGKSFKKDTLKNAIKEIKNKNKFEKKQEKKKEIPPELLPFCDKYGEFNPPLLGKYLCEKYFPFTAQGKIHIFFNGVYTTKSEFLLQEIQAIMGDKVRNKWVSEVMGFIERYRYLDSDMINPYPKIINLQNCILDWENNIIYTHDPKFLSTIRIPVKYDPNAECPYFQQFLDEALPPGDHETLLQFIGSCLYPVQKFRKALILIGKPRTGKSTLLDVIERLIGDANCSNIPLQELDENRFKRAGLYGKSINIFSDLDYRSVQNSSYFKACVSGDKIDAEHKGGEPFYFRCISKFLFSTNQLPKSFDKTPAYGDRWIFLSMEHQIPADKMDTELLTKMTTPEELSGIFNLVLKALFRLLEQNHFTISETSENLKQEWILENDPVSLFVSEHCEIGGGYTIKKSDLYKGFKEFFEECIGKHPLSQINFNSQLSKIIPDIKEVRIFGTRHWRGIKFKETSCNQISSIDSFFAPSVSDQIFPSPPALDDFFSTN